MSCLIRGITYCPLKSVCSEAHEKETFEFPHGNCACKSQNPDVSYLEWYIYEHSSIVDCSHSFHINGSLFNT